MKRTLILALAVLFVALGVMTAGLLFLNQTVDRAEQLGGEAVRAAREGYPGEAAKTLAALADFWEARTPLLEVLADHDALHDVQNGLAEARVCLECDDHDDFLRCLAVVGGALSHIRDEEALSWSNLY